MVRFRERRGDEMSDEGWSDEKDAAYGEELRRLQAECRAAVGDERFEQIRSRIYETAADSVLAAATPWGLTEAGKGILEGGDRTLVLLELWRSWRDFT